MKINKKRIPRRFRQQPRTGRDGRLLGWSVVVVEKGLAYGGPEEGDWWVDTYKVVHIETGRAMTEATAARRAGELLAGPYKRRGREVWSVNYTGGHFGAWVLPPGETQPSSGPEVWPRYE